VVYPKFPWSDWKLNIGFRDLLYACRFYPRIVGQSAFEIGQITHILGCPAVLDSFAIHPRYIAKLQKLFTSKLSNADTLGEWRIRERGIAFHLKEEDLFYLYAGEAMQLSPYFPEQFHDCAF
jgi:hypothetical protein